MVILAVVIREAPIHLDRQTDQRRMSRRFVIHRSDGALWEISTLVYADGGRNRVPKSSPRSAGGKSEDSLELRVLCLSHWGDRKISYCFECTSVVVKGPVLGPLRPSENPMYRGISQDSASQHAIPCYQI